MANVICTSKKFNNFLELTRAYSLLTSIAPWFIAVMASAVSPHIYPNVWLKLSFVVLTFIGIICTHLGGNLLDDYIDVKRKLKDGIALEKLDFKNAKNKARLMINGTYSLKQVLNIIICLFGISLLIGILFTALYGWVIPAIMLTTALLCIIYPFSSKFGFSEIIIAVIFGPLLITGSFIALTGFFSLRLLILSVAAGIMTVVLLDAHSLMDFDFDKECGKKSLCILAKSKTNALVVLGIEIILAYILVILLVLMGDFSPYLLLSIIITAPLAGNLLKSLKDYIDIKNIKFIPKWYLGPMENWDEIKKQKYDYFMYRFYMARNLVFIFCMIIAFVCYFTLKVEQYYI